MNDFRLTVSDGVSYVSVLVLEKAQNAIADFDDIKKHSVVRVSPQALTI